MEISVIIPVYNGEHSLQELNKRIHGALDKTGRSFEIIFVDDDSLDRSRAVIRTISEIDLQVRYVFFSENAGQQAAIFAGLEKSTGEIVITIDDDLQHPPEDIPLLLEELGTYEGIFAFPIEKPHIFYRKLGSFLTDRLFNWIFGKEYDLKISSFRAIRRELVNRMIAEQSGFVYISALMIINSKCLKTIYHQQFHRKYGNSNYNLKKLTRLYLNILVQYGGIRVLNGMKHPLPLYRIEEEK